jgi:dienelactone hydrolase
MITCFLGGLLALTLGLQQEEDEKPLKPPEIWKDYDPDRGDFKEEIVRQEAKDGISYRDSYISAFVLGEEVRVYCRYNVKEGATRAPGLLNVHGWMGTPGTNKEFVDDGWAVMSHDYCGKSVNRKEYTKYPERLRHGNMDREVAGPIRSETYDRKPITDPKQTSDYLWYAIERRVLSYLERQKEVDRSRLGATGYSYGGTLMWHLATDPRVKAVVAYFGIGYNDYYRDKQVWMYNTPYVEPPKTPGEEIYLAGIAPEAHVPYITAATLWLNGSNDHHGGHERGLESFKRLPKGVPGSFAVQVRAHHNTEKIGHNCKLWLDKHVRTRDVFWPEQPMSEIRLDPEGIPELWVTPASAGRVKRVEMYYAIKSPCSFTRSWRDTPCTGKDGTWVGKMPVMNVEDYVFGYANVTYDTTVVVSTTFNAAIPSRLGRAKATDIKSDMIANAKEGMSLWTDVAEVEGAHGIKGFRATNNHKGAGTEQLNDPKWRAPAGAQLGFRFYCTEPQKLILTAANYNDGEIGITASDDWQEMVVLAGRLVHRFSKQPMKDWSNVDSIHFKPAPGSDMTKVIFAEFKWVVPQNQGTK